MRAPFASLLLAAAFLSGSPAAPPEKSAPPQFPWKIPPLAAFLAKIPPPPALGTPAAQRDLATVLKLQSAATPEKIAQAERSYDLTVFTFAPAIGPDFTPQRYPQTAKFFKRLNDLVNYVNNYVKDAYKRPHPFQVSTAVKRFVIAKPGWSYPSYHSARCVVFQYVLDQLDPGHNAAFQRISAQVEKDRVFAGEHFPSDIQGGIRLGKLIRAALVKDPGFRGDIAALKKAEWTPPPRVSQ